MKNFLNVIAYGGLCNRLLFLNNIIQYTQKKDVNVNCIWFKNNEIYADLNDLFYINNTNNNLHFKIIDTKNAFGSLQHMLYKLIRKLGVGVVNQLKLYNPNDVHNSNLKFIELIGTKLFTTGCQNFYEETINFFSPKEKFNVAAVNILKKCNMQKLVSMHIRRTDHTDSKRVSTDEKIFRIIEKELTNGNFIFLACDDIEFKMKIIKKYGENQIVYQNIDIVRRDTTEAIEQALVDLICLSRGKKIYGSYASTFSYFANVLSGNELEIIK